ncbi:AAA family ATPase [Poseidonibacter lekithochrous]|uniref:AAA family ATPase n=1 Tax=Poseidonibacter lekithochrous TaxID=1904463 RepID=UPI0008FC7529|nr:AAA family ATPase [Poseidonibacter lekithochrous]QKJ23984.1 DNA phosphorothioation system protein DndD [Poseidonibacter lekithochrous]
MKLTSISINNMFSYNGVNSMLFDSISCVIGTNGFGKTSILNSIKLCLGQSNINVDSILNNNAQDKKCWVNLDFDEFNIKRTWDFTNDVEESISVVLKDGDKYDDDEAEHFIQNKIPDFLVDFLFYDGEVGNNLLLLSNAKLKSIFDYIFDLDLLVNTQKDAQSVAKRLLEKNSDDSTKELLALENQRLEILDLISNQKEQVIEDEKKLKVLKMDLQKSNTQIRNKSKKINKLHEELDAAKEELDKKTVKFKELILWQMPLLLNTNLLKGMQKRSSSALKIEDETLFTNKFSKFVQEISSPLDEKAILELFKSIMVKGSDKINLSLSRSEFMTLIEEMKDLKLEIHQIEVKIKEVHDSVMEQEMMRSLIESRDEQEDTLNKADIAFQELEESIITNTIKSKEINKTLTQAFKANQSKYAFLKGYEELQIISKTSAKVYNKRLINQLEIFNEKLTFNTTKFLKQYDHIDDIYIDNNHNIIIQDNKEKKLNTELLSAGQKQVLNFLIVKTILDFKNFASFVMVDTPFGRLSNKNKELLLNSCYLSFDSLILLLTDSEYDFVKTQGHLKYNTYQIQRNDLGSEIGEIA